MHMHTHTRKHTHTHAHTYTHTHISAHDATYTDLQGVVCIHRIGSSRPADGREKAKVSRHATTDRAVDYSISTLQHSPHSTTFASKPPDKHRPTMRCNLRMATHAECLAHTIFKSLQNDPQREKERDSGEGEKDQGRTFI